jgi:O-antigen/teichoic acid export membrane protein
LITTYIAGQKKDEFEILIIKTLRILLFFIIVFVIILFFISDYVIAFLFIDEFSAALIPLKILLPGMAFLALGKIMSSYLAGKGKPGLQSYAIFIALLIAILTNLILIPLYGIIGAAIATTSSFLIYFLLMCYLLKKYTNISIINIIYL